MKTTIAIALIFVALIIIYISIKFIQAFGYMDKMGEPYQSREYEEKHYCPCDIPLLILDVPGEPCGRCERDVKI